MIRRPPRSTPFPTRRSTDLILIVVAERPRGRLSPAPRACTIGNGTARPTHSRVDRSEEHTSELQSRQYLVCCLLLEKKKKKIKKKRRMHQDNTRDNTQYTLQ